MGRLGDEPALSVRRCQAYGAAEFSALQGRDARAVPVRRSLGDATRGRTAVFGIYVSAKPEILTVDAGRRRRGEYRSFRLVSSRASRHAVARCGGMAAGDGVNPSSSLRTQEWRVVRRTIVIARSKATKQSSFLPVLAQKKLDCFAALAMTLRYTSAFPRRDASGLCLLVSPRGRGECRAHDAPAARQGRKTSLAGNSHHRSTGSSRHSRTRVVLTSSFVLSPVIGLVCHRHRWNCFHRLDAGVEASGPHDFIVRKNMLSSEAPLASTASRPASVTIASAPLGDETRVDMN